MRVALAVESAADAWDAARAHMFQLEDDYLMKSAISWLNVRENHPVGRKRGTHE